MRFSLFFVLTFFIGSTLLAQCTITQQPAVGASAVCLGGNFPTLTVVASGGAGLTYQWYSNSINSNVGGVLINGAISSSYTPTSNTVGNTYYYCIVSEPVPVSCSTSSSVSGLFTVNPAAGAVTVSPATATVCSNQIITASANPNENIYWQGTTNNGTSTATQSSSQTVNSSGTYYFRAQTALGCWGPQGSATVTINTPVNITQQPSAIAQTVCLNASFSALSISATGTGLTYQWYSNSINSNVGGTLLNGATASSYIPTSNSVGTLYYYCIVNGTAPCVASTSSVSGLFTVNPAAGAVTVSPLSVTACGSQLLQASIGTNENIYWQGTTNNGTSTATQSSSQTVNSSGTYYFRAQTALGCWGPQGSTTVTINTPVNITQQPSAIAQTVCLNASFSALSVSATGTGLTYQWYSNSINSNIGGVLINGATASSYTPTSNSVGTLYYYCIVNGTAPCVASTSSVSGLFTVNPAAGAVTVSPLSVTACGSQLLQASIGTNENIYWQGTTNNGTSTATQSSSQTVNSSGTYYFRAQTALGCWGPQGIATVTINTPVNITQQPSPIAQTVCLNASFSALSVSATGTGLTYQWYSNSINSNVGGILLNGATASSYTPTSNSVGTLYYYCIVNGTAPCIASTSSVSGLFTINPAAGAVTVSPLSVTACGSQLLQASIGTNENIYWQGTTNNGTSTATQSSSQTVNSSGTYYFRAQTALGCWGTQGSATVTINVPVNITLQPTVTPQTVCLNGSFSAISVSATGTGLTYQWYSNSINSNIGGVLLNGATASSYTPTSNSVGTLYYYCIVNGTAPCVAQTSTVSGARIINAPVNISLQPTVTPQTVCLNGSFSALSVNATGTGLTYQWYSNSINSNVGGTFLNGATASSYTPLSNSPGTLYYYCIISGAAPCVAQTSTVSGARIVNAPVNITQQPPAIAQTVCLNASFSALSVSATGTGLTYQWYSNSSNSNLGGTLINGATSSSYTPLSNNAGTIFYYCIVSGTAPCSSQTSLVSGARIVNTPVNITQQPNPTGSQVCLNQPLSALSVSANPIGVTYQWYANAVNSNTGGTPVAGATSPVFTPQNATSGTTYYYCLVNGLTACPNIASNVSPITIYPLPPVDAGNNIAICSGSTIALNATGAPSLTWSGGYQNGVPFIPGSTQMYYVTGVDANQCVKLDSVLITVNSNPIINAGNDVTVCSGNAITLNATGALAYSWNNGVVNGSPFIPLVSSVYLVTGTNANGCQGNDMITVTVNASPQVSGGANQSVCSGNQVILAGAGASSYSWNNNIQNNVPFTPLTTQTYTLTGTAINGCTNTAQVTVTVNALPSVIAGPNQTVCAGTSVTLNGSGATSYSWNNNVQNNVSFIPLLTQTYTVTGTGANGCSNTAQVTITVLPNPVVNAGNNQTICEGSPVSLMASGTASTYSWNNNIPNGTVFYPSQTSIYTVTGTAATGCQATDDVIVTVNPLPQVSGGLNQSVCAGNQVILTGAGANTYTWNNNVQNNVPFTPLITQTYTVTGTATNGCTNTAQVSVSLLELPNINAGDSMYVCNGQEVVLWGSGAEVLTWNPTAVSGVPFIPNSSGYFYLTGSNANGCSAVDSVYITVSNSNYAQPTSLQLLGINVLYAVDSTLDYYQWGCNFNGTSVLTCAGTHFCYFPDFNPAIKEYWLDHGNSGECYRRTYYNQMNALNETVFDEIKAMPVPFTSYLTIQTDHEQEYLLDVFTIQGERIMQTQFLDNVITLTTEHWAKGVYYIQLSSRRGVQRIHVIK